MMSDIVNKALADLHTGQHHMSQAIRNLADQSDHQAVLIQALIDAVQTQAENNVPLRQDVAELKERVKALEEKAS